MNRRDGMKSLMFLLSLIELDCGADRVGCATAKLALVVDGREHF